MNPHYLTSLLKSAKSPEQFQAALLASDIKEACERFPHFAAAFSDAIQKRAQQTNLDRIGAGVLRSFVAAHNGSRTVPGIADITGEGRAANEQWMQSELDRNEQYRRDEMNRQKDPRTAQAVMPVQPGVNTSNPPGATQKAQLAKTPGTMASNVPVQQSDAQQMHDNKLQPQAPEVPKNVQEPGNGPQANPAAMTQQSKPVVQNVLGGPGVSNVKATGTSIASQPAVQSMGAGMTPTTLSNHLHS